MDLRGYPQLIIEFMGSDISIRPGSWNGQAVTGNPRPTPRLSQTFGFNEKEVYYEFELLVGSTFSVYTLSPSGTGQIYLWTTQKGSREVLSVVDEIQCDNYAICGANSICNVDGYHLTCECLKGYVPKFPQQWNLSIWTNGCVPRNESNCTSSHTDGFWKYTQMKLPDTSSSWYNKTMSLEECQKSCLKNCSCVAYANLDTRNGGSGCLLWFNNVLDVKKFSQWGGQDLYVRVPASELDHVAAIDHGNRKKEMVGITVGMIIFRLITCASILMIKNPGIARKIYNNHYKNKLRKEDVDLPTFDLSILINATENFSSSNKLGEGCFGPVYKGTLIDGQELTVKRLSKKSRQRFEEFKKKVALIAKLQHRNLIKLLGCCIQGEEKMLIYEYMPTKAWNTLFFV
ncbi:S-locus glycoprotein domain [Sesbania bispinosa]|nr:S-locus glycoprotein domain [Sesbania bispinosa]